MRGLLIAAALLLQGAPPARTQLGVITGRLLTVGGAPAADARVAALAIDSRAGNSALVSISRTDSSGAYRLIDVPAGNYLVVAGPLDQMTYFPGMPFETQAKPVAVSGGATIDAIDFRLTIRPMLSVSGRIVSDEAPGGFLTTRVTLTSNGATLWVNAGSDGKFRFPDVNPGTYQWSSSAGGAISGGNTIKVTDHDITGLEARVVLTQVRIRVSEEAVTHIDIHRRESSAGPLRLANEADRPLEFRGLQGGYLLVLRTASPLPLPDIGFSISSSAPVNMQVAAPRLHRVLLRTALEKGGPAPAFALNIDGMIAAAPAGRAGSDPAVLLRTQEVQLIGFSTDLVPSPDGTVSILLPEGNYRLGAGPARGATAPLRLKSIHSGGVDLERAPLTVSERDDIEIQIVLRR